MPRTSLTPDELEAIQLSIKYELKTHSSAFAKAFLRQLLAGKEYREQPCFTTAKNRTVALGEFVCAWNGSVPVDETEFHYGILVVSNDEFVEVLCWGKANKLSIQRFELNVKTCDLQIRFIPSFDWLPSHVKMRKDFADMKAKHSTQNTVKVMIARNQIWQIKCGMRNRYWREPLKFVLQSDDRGSGVQFIAFNRQVIDSAMKKFSKSQHPGGDWSDAKNFHTLFEV